MKRLQTRHTKATPWRTSAVGTWLGVIGAWGGWIVSADTLDGERRRRRTAVRSPMQQREMSPGGRIGATGGSRTYLIVDGCAGEPGAEPSEVVQVVSQEDDNTFSLLACFHQAMPAASKRASKREALPRISRSSGGPPPHFCRATKPRLFFFFAAAELFRPDSSTRGKVCSM